MTDLAGVEIDRAVHSIDASNSIELPNHDDETRALTQTLLKVAGRVLRLMGLALCTYGSDANRK
jgi:hypothetical protein